MAALALLNRTVPEICCGLRIWAREVRLTPLSARAQPRNRMLVVFISLSVVGLLFQAKEQVALGRCIGDAVVDDGTEIAAPVGGSQIAVGLQRPTGYVGRPGYDGLVADVGDFEQRCAGCLHGVNG